MGAVRTREEVAQLYHRHGDTVYQICLMLLKQVPDAEDAAQTVFRKVMEYEKPFRDPEHEKAWFIVTARNECKNQLKHWWRSRRVEPGILEQLSCGPPGEEGEDFQINFRKSSPSGRGGGGLAKVDLGAAGELPDDPLSLLLPGVFHPGGGRTAGSETDYNPRLAVPEPEKIETAVGGGRVWNSVN